MAILQENRETGFGRWAIFRNLSDLRGVVCLLKTHSQSQDVNNTPRICQLTEDGQAA